MKYIFILVSPLLFSGLLFSQESAPTVVEKKNNRVYFNIFELALSTFSVSYERNIKRNTLMISGGGILKKNSTSSRSGGMGEIQFRFNLVDERAGYDRSALFYLAPYTQFKYIDAEEKKAGGYNNYNSYSTYTYYNYANLRSYHVGAVLGLSLYAFKGRFSTSFYGGGGIRYVDVKGDENLLENNLFSIAYSGVLPRFGFQLGIGF